MGISKRLGSRLLAAAFACALLALGTDRAIAKTTDQSDLWWIPSESGWGIQLVQEENTIFATLFVYGPDGKPTWYVATLQYIGSFQWTGTLYATTGPWFGTIPFDPSTVAVTAVGAVTLISQFVNQDLLIYTVNGVTVAKTIQRQTLVLEDFSGLYGGTLSQTGTGGALCSAAANDPATPASVAIAQSSSTMTVTVQTAADTCTFPGNYTQGGHFGHVEGSYTCASGDSGTFRIFEMAASYYDFRARTLLTSNGGCLVKGYVDGLKQPPPSQ